MATTHYLHNIVLSVAIVCLFRNSLGHSFILVPRGDFSNFNKAECRQGGPDHAPNDDCKGPCFRKDNWQYDENEGTTTYARGEKVDMVWATNNHRGGFIRFTLVPECLRMDEKAHDIYAFRYACYDSDKQACTFDTSTERRCGSGEYVQQTKVEIPTSLENGFYTLGWAWYGGLDWQYKSMFGDYWSCSRIQIKGGPLTESYDPVFNPGENIKDVDLENPTCLSSTARLRDCAREPCLGRPVGPLVPTKFNGRKPNPILQSWTSETNKCKTPSLPVPPLEGPRSLPQRVQNAYVTALRLIDVATNDVLAGRFPSTVYVPAQVKGLSFIAIVRGEVASVSFYINGELTQVERAPPYIAFGGKAGKAYAWPKPIYKEWVKMRVLVTARSGTKHQKTFDFYLRKGTPPKTD